MTDNKKLLKEFSTIYASCNRAKQGAIAEISKIDEKYRKLAEKEKEQLNELVKALDSQLELYGSYLGLKKEEEVAEEAKDEVVVDNLYPENNEEDPSKVCELPIIEEEIITEKPVEKNEEKKESPASVSVSDDSFPPAAPVDIDWSVSDQKEETKMTKEDIVATLEGAGFVNIETVAAEEKKEPMALEFSEDGWADFPEDWK